MCFLAWRVEEYKRILDAFVADEIIKAVEQARAEERYMRFGIPIPARVTYPRNGLTGRRSGQKRMCCLDCPHYEKCEENNGVGVFEPGCCPDCRFYIEECIGENCNLPHLPEELANFAKERDPNED